jgi:hypothetical protein
MVFNTILYENEFQNPQIFQIDFSRAIYFRAVVVLLYPSLYKLVIPFQ